MVLTFCVNMIDLVLIFLYLRFMLISGHQATFIIDVFLSCTSIHSVVW